MSLMDRPVEASSPLPLRDYQVITELDAQALTADQRATYLVHIS